MGLFSRKQDFLKEFTIGVSIIPFGAFRGNPLNWRVLDVDARNGRALLITEDIIEKRRYHRKANATWEKCELREYLNGDFLDSFGTDRSRIAQVENANPDNQWYGTNGGGSTKDKVFLLSLGGSEILWGQRRLGKSEGLVL
jgi:hypothetical protein